MAVIKLINYDQLYTTLESVKAYIDNTMKKYLPLSGGTITDDLYVNKYLGINAYTNYGSGTVKMWFNGTNSALSILGANNIAIGDNENTVLHTGNHFQHVLTLGGGELTGSLAIAKHGNKNYLDVDANSIYMYNQKANMSLNIMDIGTLTFDGKTVLHYGNYANYAMPLSGGAFKGSIKIPNDKYILSFTPSGAEKSYLGVTASNNCVVGNVASKLVLRAMENPNVKIPVDGVDKDYTLYHAGNHVIKDHCGQTAGKNDPLGTIYTKMYNSESSPQSYITRVTAMYNSENKEDFASFGLFNPAGDGSSVNYINVYADRVFTKGYYRSSDDFIILGGHRLTINSDEPSTKTKGDIWIQI